MCEASRYATVESMIAGQIEVQSHAVGSITWKPLTTLTCDFSLESHREELPDARQDGISLVGCGVSLM